MLITFKCNIFAEERRGNTNDWKTVGLEIHLPRRLVHRLPSVLSLLNSAKNKSGNEMNKLPESGPPSLAHSLLLTSYILLVYHLSILFVIFSTSGPMENASRFCAVDLHTKYSMQKFGGILFRFDKRKELLAKFLDYGSISSKKKKYFSIIFKHFLEQADCLEKRLLPQHLIRRRDRGYIRSK